MSAKHTPIDVLLTAIAHTCRDEGYSPYVKPCRGCMSQLSINSVALHNARKRRAAIAKATGDA